ncbi:MAG: hypothetical protein PHY71_00485 [Bacteroidaceae bacterium]|nr:hypothetical protein [Bacteroidaceae bacterium]
MKTYITLIAALSTLLISCTSGTQRSHLADQKSTEKTSFQTAQAWRPSIHVDADVAIVYGANDYKAITFQQRVESWRSKGYTTHFMTGIAWGNYADYFTGKWDGKSHYDEGQVTLQGDTIWHGKETPYIVPTLNFLKYMQQEHIKKAIDAGIDVIYLEEPEYWAFAGYSEAFKREWKAFYHTPWEAQDQSPRARYLANKLKYHLYYRALQQCFSYAKRYGKTLGRTIRCFVPTHSLINYSQWQIVSPEASLASLTCVDGYIAQVWTGTSRVPNYFNGVYKERVFETAFMEYGTLQSMTAPTHRKVYFLTDPIEDRPRDWSDFKKNYEATFVAQLMYPMNANYEVMPWPERIYEGWYQTSEKSEKKMQIPRYYATQIQVMINALKRMQVDTTEVNGTKGISVLMSNSLMFQRSQEKIANYEDPQLSNFFGLVLPLLKRGIPVNTLHLENVGYQKAWENTQILLMTYSNMKPQTEEAHQAIADWVEKGGTLIYAGSDTDPFQQVPEWWNSGSLHYEHPANHLFALLHIAKNPKEGVYRYGKGMVYVMRKDPKAFVLHKEGDKQLLATIEQIYQEKKTPVHYKNYFALQRGVYTILAVMEESTSAAAKQVTGCFIDLFDPNLPVLSQKTVKPGEQALLLSIDRIANKQTPQVLAGSARISDEKIKKNSYTFVAKSPLNTNGVFRVLLPQQPTKVAVSTADKTEDTVQYAWDEKSHTLLLRMENNPQGIDVSIGW